MHVFFKKNIYEKVFCVSYLIIIAYGYDGR